MGQASTTTRPGPFASAWHIAIGLLIVACGLFALMAPILSTFAMSVVIAVSASIAGLVQIVHSFRSRTASALVPGLLLGIAYLCGGIAFWIWPFTGAKFLTMILAWTLITAGFAQIAIAIAFRGEQAWRWMLFSGALALALGVWLMFRLHIASLFVPGIAWSFALLGEGIAILAGATDQHARKPATKPASRSTTEPVAEPENTTPFSQ